MDKVEEKLKSVVEKAAEILMRNRGKWSTEVEAYWLLVRNEDKIGFPITYDIVEAAIERVRVMLMHQRQYTSQEDYVSI